LYRAIDQFGQVIDALVSERRDLAAARRFFARALSHGRRPVEVTTDRAAAYPQVLDEQLPAAPIWMPGGNLVPWTPAVCPPGELLYLPSSRPQ
jgi:hypothetical protein